MTPKQVLDTAIDPALELLRQAGVRSDDRARLEVLTIAGQESAWKARRQVGIGQYHPQTIGARGLWQFESTWGGPVALNDVQQKAPKQLAVICQYFDLPADELSLYEACAWHDILAASLARLLLWVDPRPLPDVGAEDEAWHYYVDNWRPGAPHRATWSGYYTTALGLVRPPR